MLIAEQWNGNCRDAGASGFRERIQAKMRDERVHSIVICNQEVQALFQVFQGLVGAALCRMRTFRPGRQMLCLRTYFEIVDIQPSAVGAIRSVNLSHDSNE